MLRLLANPSVMGNSALAPSAAWVLLEDLRRDERLEFVVEPPHMDAIIPRLLRYPVPTGKLITDAYLAAFAIASNRRLVTLDAGFRQFEGVELDLLVSPGFKKTLAKAHNCRGGSPWAGGWLT